MGRIRTQFKDSHRPVSKLIIHPQANRSYIDLNYAILNSTNTHIAQPKSSLNIYEFVVASAEPPQKAARCFLL